MSNTDSYETDTERLLAEATGEIDKALFTQTGSGGPTSEGYLADRPPIEYLAEDALQYLLAGNEGVTVKRHANVEARDDDRTGVYTTDGTHRAFVLVTDRRVVFIVGSDNGDTAVTLPIRRITAVQTDGGLTHGTLIVSSDRHEHVFKTERSAAVEEAAAYLREQSVTLGSNNGVVLGDHELLPEALAEYAPDGVVLESASRGTLPAARHDIAWLTGVHARLGTELAETTRASDNRVLLNAVEELLSVLQTVETALTEIKEQNSEVDSETVKTAESAVVGTPVDGPLFESHSVPDPELADDAPALQRELQRLAGAHHRIPTRQDVVEHGEYDISCFERYGDSWKAVTESAGFDLSGQMINHLQEVNNNLSETVTPDDLVGTTYEYGRYVSVFDSWEAALDAAKLDKRRGQMLAAVQQCHDKLECIPNAADLETETAFTQHEYTTEFGSVQEAIVAVGLDYEAAFCEAVAAVAEKLGHPPTTTEFDESSGYSSNTAYKFFDSWDDALVAAGVEQPPADDGPPRTPLSEWYDAVRGLNKLQRTLYGSQITKLSGDPGAAWVELIRSVAAAEGLEPWEAGYAYQHETRVDHTIERYREAYGNGDRVTDFDTVETISAPESVELVADDIDADSISIPVTPGSGTPLPVVVTTEAELDRAEELLTELPERPEATSAAVEELTAVNGVNQETAQTLIHEGYDSVDVLANATTEDLAAVDGIDDGRAFRITFALDD